MKRNSSQRVQSILKQLHSLQIGEIADLENELARYSNRALRSIIAQVAASAAYPPANPDGEDEPSPFGDDAPVSPGLEGVPGQIRS
jgi:hypothetical protein